MSILRFLSFRNLLLAGFFIVAGIPSLALVQLRRELAVSGVAEQQQQQLASHWRDAARVTREEAMQFERATRQALILKDDTLRRAADAAWLEVRQAQLPLLQSAEPGLQDQARDILALCDQLRRLPPQAHGQRDSLFHALDALQERQVRTMSERLAQKQDAWRRTLEDMRQTADKRARLSVVAALVLALLMAVGLSWPLRRLQHRIARMSDGARCQDWSLPGPADLQRLAGELSHLDQRLTTLEEQKGRFFRHVSHELKTPLAAISEAAALLQEEVAGALSPAQHEVVAILASSAATLRGRIDALLRDDAGQWLADTLTLQSFSLTALVDERLRSLAVVLNAKKLRTAVKGDPGPVTGDRSKVETILDNLLLNATRHSPPSGQVSIRLGREREWIWLEVADQGAGVAAEDEEKIFEPFWSGTPPAGELPGSGLGLTMARGFAQRMRGDVTLQASPDGACFRLSWPEADNSKP